MNAIKEFFGNKWVKFAIASTLYILWFVVWTGNMWMLLGEVIIYDVYISRIMHKLFWGRHKLLKKSNRQYKYWAEWIEAIVFATVAATLIRIFFFEMYVIPTPSMEKSLLVGDYLCVSKVAYGPKMPNTPISFPFVHNTMPFSQTKKSYSEAVKWPYHRLKGWGEVKRGDVVVFNFPAGDTVLLEKQEITYYSELRQYQAQLGEAQGRKELEKSYTIVSRPVDKRENYVKRCVGVPGDTLTMRGGQLYINGQTQDHIPAMQHIYYVQTNGAPINKTAFEKMGISQEDRRYMQTDHAYYLPLTDKNAAAIEKMGNIVQVARYAPLDGPGEDIFPQDARYPWNVDNFGPLWIPSRGATVQLTVDNLPLYRRIIEVYEANKLEVRADSAIMINGAPAESYTFKMNYYFMMGDNRHCSADSRYWGFVPEDHVVGKASFVWFSTDKDQPLLSPRKIRWSRLFHGTKSLQNRP